MAREVMQEKQEVVEEKEKNCDDQATDDIFPGWKKLVGVGEATSRQLCRLELANKK